MKRMKKHKVKKEKSETSTSHTREQEDHDLAFYIHDRVELMHQVFSVLKYKELMAVAPECIRHNISINDLQELCTEELLGISSKRLCATLDGAEPPSDTESSSESCPEQLETISLDSISSDEGMLSPGSGKRKKHKHRRRSSSKCKRKSKGKDSGPADLEQDKSKASRAGLTVLELLELQARARAIRAQLHQEHTKRPSETQPAETSTRSDGHHSDVEIKEEPAEVVEISSDEEKPNVDELNAAAEKPPPSPLTPKEPEITVEPETVTKHVKDLIITIPKAKPTRRIKLNRNKVLISVPNVQEKSDCVPSEISVIVDKEVRDVAKPKKKQKKKGKSKSDAKEGSDHDEITLQLSDSEKMDLLEDLDRKVFESVSSSEDSESSSSDDEEMEREKQKDRERAKEREKLKEKEREKQKKDKEVLKEKEKEKEILKEREKEKQNQKEKDGDTLEERQKLPSKGDSSKKDHEGTVLGENLESNNATEKEISDTTDKEISDRTDKCTDIANEEEITVEVSHTEVNNDKETDKPIEVQEQTQTDSEKSIKNTESNLTKTIEAADTEAPDVTDDSSPGPKETNMPIEISTIEDIPIIDDKIKDSTTNTENGITEKENKNNGASETASIENEIDKDKSDGEVSDRDSSEVEAVELKAEVVCISDEERGKKKKKKKDKKKKEKKSKKTKSDFREGADQNFFRETDECSIDDVYEILELSDDSSCYEVEGTVLSKEPTAEEIAALSAKIDEIDRQEVVTEEQIQDYENSEVDKYLEAPENISWKDRYLDSRKVKRVLSTANILNALRKKNKELKKKMEESKKEVPIVIEKVVEKETVNEDLEEGSIEQYNTLQGSTTYVDPIPEVTEDLDNTDENNLESSVGDKEGEITREMKRDAKQLLKMYKRLLKYNDINKEKDPNKKKKKKQKKNKDKNKDIVNGSVAITEVTNGV